MGEKEKPDRLPFFFVELKGIGTLSQDVPENGGLVHQVRAGVQNRPKGSSDALWISMGEKKERRPFFVGWLSSKESEPLPKKSWKKRAPLGNRVTKISKGKKSQDTTIRRPGAPLGLMRHLCGSLRPS